MHSGPNAFAFTDEQDLARKMLRRWCEKHLAPQVAAMERGEILPYDIGRALFAAFGVADMVRGIFDAPKGDGRDGGDGGQRSEATSSTPALIAIAGIELSRVCPGFALAIGASVGLAGGAILSKGSPAQRREFALPLLGLEKIGAWGMTEPGAGSDAFGGMRTTARRDGEEYVLRGQKTFITNAPYADVFVVYAKVIEAGGDHGGSASGSGGGENPEAASRQPIHAFILERGAPGLSLGRPMEKMGMHSSPTGEIFLDDVRVHRSRLLGERGDQPSRTQARDALQGERAAMVPMCLGIVERCLEDSVRYAKERVAFGKPIAEQQLIQDKLARMYVHRENMRNLLHKQLHLAARGERLSRAEASACKLYCSRAATDVALEAVQIMGGAGYMRSSHVEMLMRDAKLFQIGGGTDEIQILTIARELLATE